MYRSYLFVSLLGIALFPFSVRAAGGPYSPEVLANLVKPSVVRIIAHTVGEAEIVPVKIDIKRGLIAVADEAGVRKKVKVDEYISGSGLIINPDGYIATNAHVVSEGTIKQMLASDSAMVAFYENALSLSEAESQDFLQSEEAEVFGKKVLKVIIESSHFDLKTDVFVLNPASQKEKASDLAKEGFAAHVESVNENFLDDDRDVAIVKVDLDHLPALPIVSNDVLSVGSTTYTFGFPGTAEFNSKSPTEATFTRGVVSAIKTAMNRDFPIYQTDAKVSQGSSGGPLFNDHGEVVGLITFQTGELNRSSGDNFAFALPSTLIVEEAKKIGLVLNQHDFFTAFTQGVDAYQERRCKDADRYFGMVEGANTMFSLQKYIGPYRARCAVIQANGEALDTRWDIIRNKTETLGVPLLSVIGILLLLLSFFGTALFWLVRQVRREEGEIASLRQQVKEDEHHFMEQRYGGERIKIRLGNMK